MRREDLFNAIGMVEDKRLVRCEKNRGPSMVIHEEDSKMKNGKYSNTRRSAGVKRIWLIAAVIALATVLMGSAIAALVSMRVENVGVNSPIMETVVDEHGNVEQTWIDDYHEGEKVNFDEVHDVFIELGSWYPQEIPEGYTMTFVSDGAPLQNQDIFYENNTGEIIEFLIYIADPASDAEIYDILSKTEVQINGQDGILYEQTGGYRTLVWINEDQGFGFKLSTADTEVDLIAMAESTAEGEPLVPTRSESTVKAVEELGDYYPEYLPEGFVEQGTMGSPIAEGDGWYSYVRKWYVNKEENTQIYFEYETYVIDTESGYTDDARTVCSFFIPGCDVLKNEIAGEEVEINGMYGLAIGNHIAWADPETHVVYHLTSEDVIGEELLKVAQSMIKK